MDASVNISEGDFKGNLNISAHKGLLGRYTIKEFNLNLEGKNGKVSYSIEKKGLYQLRKKVDIKTPTFILEDTYTLGWCEHPDVVPVEISGNGIVDRVIVKGANVNIEAKRENDMWHVNGEITYDGTLSGLIRHSLSVIEEETGLSIKKYIDEALKGEDWKK